MDDQIWNELLGWQGRRHPRCSAGVDGPGAGGCLCGATAARACSPRSRGDAGVAGAACCWRQWRGLGGLRAASGSGHGGGDRGGCRLCQSAEADWLAQRAVASAGPAEVDLLSADDSFPDRGLSHDPILKSVPRSPRRPGPAEKRAPAADCAGGFAGAEPGRGRAWSAGAFLRDGPPRGGARLGPWTAERGADPRGSPGPARRFLERHPDIRARPSGDARRYRDAAGGPARRSVRPGGAGCGAGGDRAAQWRAAGHGPRSVGRAAEGDGRCRNAPPLPTGWNSAMPRFGRQGDGEDD